VSGNDTGGFGGGITDAALSGIQMPGAAIVLDNVTVTQNHAYVDGGGVYGANELSASNTILSGNLPADCGGPLPSGGYDLIGDGTGCTIVDDLTGNLIGVDPLLGPLADNGGPTKTHLPAAASPAVDAGNPATSGAFACEPTDQRGVARPIGPRCDI